MATKTKTINLRTTEDAYSAIKEFADFNGQTITDFMLEAAISQIEDYEDLRDAAEASEAIKSGKSKVVSWEQVQKEAGLL